MAPKHPIIGLLFNLKIVSKLEDLFSHENKCFLGLGLIRFGGNYGCHITVGFRPSYGEEVHQSVKNFNPKAKLFEATVGIADKMGNKNQTKNK